MWQDRRILDLLHIEHPIIQAPMAGASNAELIAAVNGAGALGSFGAAGTEGDQLRRVLASIRERTRRPFNINLFSDQSWHYDAGALPGPALASQLDAYHRELGLGEVPATSPLFGPTRAQLDILLAERVPVISFHFGVDAATVALARSEGAVVLCTATTVTEAQMLERAGVDAIIAQGAEAGGHRGTFATDYRRALIGTLALVPQVVDAVAVPVVAAGGVMDARGLVACLALGASAVQLGTAFLGCPETAVAPAWQRSLADASAADTVVTDLISGKPARCIRNRLVDDLDAMAERPLAFPAQYSLTRELRSMAKTLDRSEFLAMWAGQGVGLIKPQFAAALVQELVSDAASLIARMAGVTQGEHE
jgi:nitronate monooxygenase